MFIRQHIAAALVGLFGSIIGMQYLKTADDINSIVRTDSPSVTEVNRMQMSIKPTNSFELPGVLIQTDTNKYAVENTQNKPKPKPKTKPKPKPKPKSKLRPKGSHQTQNIAEEIPDWAKR